MLSGKSCRHPQILRRADWLDTHRCASAPAGQGSRNGVPGFKFHSVSLQGLIRPPHSLSVHAADGVLASAGPQRNLHSGSKASTRRKHEKLRAWKALKRGNSLTAKPRCNGRMSALAEASGNSVVLGWQKSGRWWSSLPRTGTWDRAARGCRERPQVAGYFAPGSHGG